MREKKRWPKDVLERAETLRLSAQYEKAERLLEAALSKHDNDAFDAAALYSELGIVRKAAGKYAQARMAYRQAMSNLKTAEVPLVSSAYASLYHNLGGLEHAKRRHARAQGYAEKSVRLRQAVFGANSIELARDKAALGAILFDRREYRRAERIFREVLLIFRKSRKNHLEDLVVNLNNLGATTQKLGRPLEAERYYRESLSYRTRFYGKSHPETALALNNLGYFLKSQGRHDHAEAAFREALEIFQRTLPRHPHTAAVLHNLAGLLWLLGRRKEAWDFKRKQNQIERHLKESHRHAKKKKTPLKSR